MNGKSDSKGEKGTYKIRKQILEVESSIYSLLSWPALAEARPGPVAPARQSQTTPALRGSAPSSTTFTSASLFLFLSLTHSPPQLRPFLLLSTSPQTLRLLSIYIHPLDRLHCPAHIAGASAPAIMRPSSIKRSLGVELAQQIQEVSTQMRSRTACRRPR